MEMVLIAKYRLISTRIDITDKMHSNKRELKLYVYCFPNCIENECSVVLSLAPSAQVHALQR